MQQFFTAAFSGGSTCDPELNCSKITCCVLSGWANFSVNIVLPNRYKPGPLGTMQIEH